MGYDEVNINCGCPSDKAAIQGCFGAKLMFSPDLVAKMVYDMRRQVQIPVTIKCRLGVDDHDTYEHSYNFIKTVSEKGGAEKFVIHARKCLLDGLSPH
jgi:tRNA-dihydrouridine synthase A